MEWSNTSADRHLWHAACGSDFRNSVQFPHASVMASASVNWPACTCLEVVSRCIADMAPSGGSVPRRNAAWRNSRPPVTAAELVMMEHAGDHGSVGFHDLPQHAAPALRVLLEMRGTVFHVAPEIEVDPSRMHPSYWKYLSRSSL